MAFTVADFHDLLRLLQEHPEWRDDLRRVLLSDELLNLPAAFARLEAVVERLAEAVRRLTERVDAMESRLERVEGRLEGIETGLEGVDGRLSEHGEHFERIEGVLSEHGEHFERIEGGLSEHGERLERLEIGQRRLQGDVDQLVGSDWERKFRQQVVSIYGRWLRRLRLVETHELDDLFGELIDREQFLDLLRADAVLRGRLSGAGHPEVWLVAEVSRVVDRADVERAARRAAVLREAGVAAIGVAAGEEVTEGAAALAAREKVAVQTDGRVTGWDEALAATGLGG